MVENVTANVSFYLIAILALRVKAHSLHERNVLGNVLIVDHHVKKYLNKHSEVPEWRPHRL